ncbi:MAG TPA: glutaminyl-peptide cyclotransferase [Thermoanaerobaculia bacterium]|nr:glutaminyl-peptide cyclotransferase [Thermoanaerobaculia bacterium]
MAKGDEAGRRSWRSRRSRRTRPEGRRTANRWLWGGAAVTVLALALLAWRLAAPTTPPPTPSAPSAASAPASASSAPSAPVSKATPVSPAVEHLAVKVISVHPHDPSSYTQGLLWYRGELYESGGLYGQSSLRRTYPPTGTIHQVIAVPAADFAEGLALVGERLFQLTWREGVAFLYDRASFLKVGEFHYQGEGWGLCYDGKQLVMSDGSDRLTVRDPQTFTVIGEIAVRRDGVPVEQLNELECVGTAIYANVYQTDEIVRIDAATGRVTASIDASGLLTPEERQKTDVLNGIAWNPETRRFWITGKLWPKMFEVEFVPAVPVAAPAK